MCVGCTEPSWGSSSVVRKGTGEAWEDGKDKEAEDTDGARSLLEGVLGPKDHMGPSGALRGPGPGQRDLTVIRERKRERDLGEHGPLGRRGRRPMLLFHPSKVVQLACGCPTTDSTSQHPSRQAWSCDDILASMPHSNILFLRENCLPFLPYLPLPRLEGGHRQQKMALEGTRVQKEQGCPMPSLHRY